MSSENILSGNINQLLEIKEKILEVQRGQERMKLLTEKENKLEEEMENTHQLLENEIASTVRIRKNEVEKSFEEQIDKLKTRMKKIQSKKEKLKNAKVSKRIEIETADLMEENEAFHTDIRKIYKENRISRLFNNKFFYSLFIPKCFTDFIVLAASILIAYLAIPCSIYYFFVTKKTTVVLILIYFICVIVFLGLYIAVNRLTIGRHRTQIIEAARIRKCIRMNKKKMNAIKKDVIKDKDESGYGLEKFNKELKQLDDDIKEVEENKKNAINNFQKTAKLIIETEIKVKYQEELEKRKKECEEIHDEINKYQENLKNLSLLITNNYEAYLGKEYVSVEKLDALINMMKNKNFSTISEAVNEIEREKRQQPNL